MLYDPGGLLLTNLFFFSSFWYSLSSNQILCGDFNKSKIESHFCETLSHLYRRGGGGSVKNISSLNGD